MANPSAAISPLHSAASRRQRLLRRAFVVVPSALVVLASTWLLITVIALVSEPVDVTRSSPFPIPGWLERQSRRDAVAYPIHAALGTILNAVGSSPVGASIQWYKAAAHARTADEVERAAHGIMAARQRDPDGESVDAALCAPIVRRGARVTQVAAMGQAGLPCGAAGEAEARLHVPSGTRVVYASRPPTSGPHYGDWWRTYGPVDQALPAGVWLHNLEHGAVVLLYNCPSACPELVSQLESLYARMPPDSNGQVESPRLLIIPYTDMDRRIAIVAWDQVVELDAVDADAILGFYSMFVNRGPECVNLRCRE